MNAAQVLADLPYFGDAKRVLMEMFPGQIPSDISPDQIIDRYRYVIRGTVDFEFTTNIDAPTPYMASEEVYSELQYQLSSIDHLRFDRMNLSKVSISRVAGEMTFEEWSA